jgi:hypothetical protein
MDMKKGALVVYLAMILAACSPPISETAKWELRQPVNCKTAHEDLRILEQEKARTEEQILNGVTAITPAGAATGILMGTEGEKIEVATGEYNDKLEAKINEIKRTCGIR